jgi:riboflavin-specific deaminase-like protein
MTVHLGLFQKSETDPLLEPLLEAPDGQTYVIAQLGQSLDGRIATPTGESRWINRGAALDHLHRLRAHVDAVVVGVGTVVEDDPELTVRRVTGKHPARVIIDPRGRIPARARCLADDGVRRLILTGAPRTGPVPANVEIINIETRGPRLDPVQMITALARAGLHKILIEGGATTVSHFIDAGALDRLHVLVAPVIIGSGVQGLNLTPISRLSDAMRPATRVHVLDDGDVLFDCDMRRTGKG